MGYVNSNIAKSFFRTRFFKELSLIKEIGIFFITSFKNRFHCYNELLFFLVFFF